MTDKPSTIPSVTDEPTGPILELTVDGGPTTTVVLAGELDPATAPNLRDAVGDLVADPDVERVVLDLSGLTFLDSSGLRVFVTAREELRERGAELVLRGPSANTQRLLDITGLGEIIAVD